MRVLVVLEEGRRNELLWCLKKISLSELCDANCLSPEWLLPPSSLTCSGFYIDSMHRSDLFNLSFYIPDRLEREPFFFGMQNNNGLCLCLVRIVKNKKMTSCLFVCLLSNPIKQRLPLRHPISLSLDYAPVFVVVREENLLSLSCCYRSPLEFSSSLSLLASNQFIFSKRFS